MLDPLFPLRLETLTANDARTIMTGEGYAIVFSDQGRLSYRHTAERGVLETGRLFLAGEGTAATLTLQRSAVARVVRFGRAFYDKLAVQFYDSGFLDGFFPAGGGGRPAPPVILAPARTLAQVRTLFERLAGEYEQRLSRHALMIQSLLTELFILLDRERDRDTTGAAAVVPANVNALMHHIQEHYSDEFSLEELAARMGLTPAYFSRLFHEKTGKPLFEFINSIRIQKACQLLKRTGLPVIEIAYAVGYNNLSFFNRYFRKLMRMSPREYRSL
jgi:AraC-like DNA-binding protein